MISWHGLKSANELIKLVICGHNYWKKSISEEENHNEMGKKNNIHVFTFANIYVFLYGPIEDLFIRSSGYNFALKMITARAYGLTVAW